MSKKDGFLGRRLTLKSNALFRFAPLVKSAIGGGGPSGSWSNGILRSADSLARRSSEPITRFHQTVACQPSLLLFFYVPWSDAQVFENFFSFHDKAVLLMGLGIDLR